MKNLYIIDDLNVVFRMFFGVPPMSYQGIPTNVVYWYLKTIKTLVEHGKNETGEVPHIVVATDIKGKSSRLEIYDQYKANRTTEMPDDCKAQIPYVKELLYVLWIEKLGFEGFEADDVIGSLSKKHRHDYEAVYIVSSDKDLCQLIDTNVFCMDAQKQKVWSLDNVSEKFWVGKQHVVDYLSLVWDSSDNIPGVLGIGVKTAIKIISDFGGIEEIYATVTEDHVSKKLISKSVYQKLMDGKELAHMSKRLATIDTSLDVSITWDHFNENVFNTNEFKLFCQELWMKSFL